MAMVAHTTTRPKNGRTYRQTCCQCAGATDKGPAVCRHTVRYRQDHLEGALIGRFREATATPETIERLAELVNARVEVAARGCGARAEALAAEIVRLERESRYLVRFVAQGGNGPSVQDELRQLDGELERRRTELTVLEAARRAAPTHVHPTWIRKRLTHLDELLAHDPARARVEILKHLDGPGRVRPLPAPAGQRAAEITWRVKPGSLLTVDDQEAGCLRMVAGARNHRNRLASPSRWMSSDCRASTPVDSSHGNWVGMALGKWEADWASPGPDSAERAALPRHPRQDVQARPHLQAQSYRLRNMGLGGAPSPSRTASAIRSGRSDVSGSSVMSRRR